MEVAGETAKINDRDLFRLLSLLEDLRVKNLNELVAVILNEAVDRRNISVPFHVLGTAMKLTMGSKSDVARRILAVYRRKGAQMTSKWAGHIAIAYLSGKTPDPVKAGKVLEWTLEQLGGSKNGAIHHDAFKLLMWVAKSAYISN